MSERGNFRGGRGGRGDRGGRGASSSDRGGRGGSQASGGEKKKENILDLTKYMDKEITVKFNGGREGMHPYLQVYANPANHQSVTGTLKGYDQLMNLVLDSVKEITRGEVGVLSILSSRILMAL